MFGWVDKAAHPHPAPTLMLSVSRTDLRRCGCGAPCVGCAGSVLTYGALLRRIHGVALGLAARGVAPGAVPGPPGRRVGAQEEREAGEGANV